MRQVTLSATVRAIYPLCVRHAVLLALTLTYLSNASAITAIARQRPAEGPDPMRQQALLALEDIYSESKAYEDLGLRVRVKAQLADVLWVVDPARAIDILTATFDDTSALKQDPARRRSLRSEVIRVASRHDRELVKNFIARLDANKEDVSGEPPARDSFDRSTERGGLLLDAASTLLNADDQQGAVSLARRSLSEGRAGRFLFFLSQLMEKDKAAGEKLFLEALAVLRQGPADPNDLLFYGMWMFYPNSLAVGTLGPRTSGVSVYSYGMDFGAAKPRHPELLRPYLETSADVLVRFRPIPGPETMKSVELKRFALRQLLPVFEVYLPERAEAMRAELNYLGVAPSWAIPPQDVPGFKADPRFAADLSPKDVVASINKIPDDKERDDLFFRGAMHEFNHGGDLERARVFASEITKPLVKELLITGILYKAALNQIEQGKLDEAEQTASKLNRERRAEVYAQLSKAWMERGNRSRAAELMNWAASEAGKVDDRSRRAGVYVYLTDAVMNQDSQRAFEFLEAAVKDINALEKFEPTGSVLLLELQSPEGGKSMLGFSRSVSLVTVIPPLAKTDLYRAITAARSLSVPAPRALAVIAACRDVLAAGEKPVETKKTESPAKQPSKKQETKREKDKQG
jgi:tetratricopeptide (TPR) repeat protein